MVLLHCVDHMDHATCTLAQYLANVLLGLNWGQAGIVQDLGAAQHKQYCQLLQLFAVDYHYAV